MAKERMITRTIEEVELTHLVVNAQNNEVDTKVSRISAHIDSYKWVEYLNKNVNPKGIYTATILHVERKTTLYGMTENEFLKLAKPIIKAEETQGA